MLTGCTDIDAQDDVMAELAAASDIIRDFQDDPFLLRALMHCAPVLAAAQALDSDSPAVSIGTTMHALRRQAFELLRMLDDPPPLPSGRHTCPQCHGCCDPDWGCDLSL